MKLRSLLATTAAVVALLVPAVAAFAWQDAPPVVDCAGVSHPALGYGTEDAYHAAVAQQAATVCQPVTPPAPPVTPPAPPSPPAPPQPPAGPPSHTSTVAVCHAEDDNKTLVQSTVERNVLPYLVQSYLHSASGLDYLMVPGGNCGPTT